MTAASLELIQGLEEPLVVISFGKEWKMKMTQLGLLRDFQEQREVLGETSKE